MNLAPIGIPTYSRLIHLTKTINSLKTNHLAKESELYIFLDAPKIGDEEKVGAVREYIYTVNGFKKVHIIERKENNIYQNHYLAIQQLFDEYGKVIFMEDDNIVSSDFLEFMNDGLNFYKNQKNIMAINGFNVPVSKNKYLNHCDSDIYLSSFFCAAGFATWADRSFIKVATYNNGYNDLMKDPMLRKKVKAKKPNLLRELKLIQEGKLDAGDFNITYHMIKNDMYVVKPLESKVNNIGHDGSGVNCEKSDKFSDQKVSNKKIIFHSGVTYNSAVDNVWRSFFDDKGPFLVRIKRKINKFLKSKK